MTAEEMKQPETVEAEPGAANEAGEPKDPGMTSIRVRALLEGVAGTKKETASGHPASLESWNLAQGDMKSMPENVQAAFKKGAEVLAAKFKEAYGAQDWNSVGKMEITVLGALNKAKELCGRIAAEKAKLDQQSGGNESGPYAGTYDRLADAEEQLVAHLESGEWDEVEADAREADKWRF